MAQSTSQKRPWLAAVLGALVTGLGHVYLRRWRRALGWLVASTAVTLLFVDPGAAGAFMSGGATPDELLAVAPMFLVVGLSVADAYVLARTQRAVSSASDASGEESIPCPHCGRPLDPDLEFCHWCTSPVDDGSDPEDAADDR